MVNGYVKRGIRRIRVTVVGQKWNTCIAQNPVLLSDRLWSCLLLHSHVNTRTRHGPKSAIGRRDSGLVSGQRKNTPTYRYARRLVGTTPDTDTHAYRHCEIPWRLSFDVWRAWFSDRTLVGASRATYTTYRQWKHDSRLTASSVLHCTLRPQTRIHADCCCCAPWRQR